MSILSNIYVIFIVLFNVTLLVYCATQCGPIGLKKFDSDVAKLVVVGSSGRKLPEDRGPYLKKFCDETTRLVKEIEDYRNECMDNMPKQVAGFLLYSGKSMIKQFCRKGSKSVDKLLDAGVCGNAGIAQMNKCYTRAIDLLLGIQTSKEDKKKIPWLCCGVYDIITCLQDNLQDVKQCTHDRQEVIFSMVRQVSGRTMDVFCGEYNEGSDKCDKLEKPPKKLKSQRRTKSFAIPIIDVLKGFPEI